MAQTAEGNRLTAEQRKSMCTSKKRFLKEGMAIDFVIARKRQGRMQYARVYRCPVCVGYHVATQMTSVPATTSAGA